MAVQMILRLDDIAGESKKDGHEAEIDISSWAFGMSQSGTWHTGGGGGGGLIILDASPAGTVNTTLGALLVSGGAPGPSLGGGFPGLAGQPGSATQQP